MSIADPPVVPSAHDPITATSKLHYPQQQGASRSAAASSNLKRKKKSLLRRGVKGIKPWNYNLREPTRPWLSDISTLAVAVGAKRLPPSEHTPAPSSSSHLMQVHSSQKRNKSSGAESYM